MKYKGSILEFTHDRNEALMAAYRFQLKHTGGTLDDIFDAISRMPAARFWVSEDRAGAVLAGMFKGRPLMGMRPLRRAMFEEIYRRAVKLRKSYPDMSPYKLAEKVIYQPAPSFFLSVGTIGAIIYKIKRGDYDDLKGC